MNKLNGDGVWHKINGEWTLIQQVIDKENNTIRLYTNRVLEASLSLENVLIKQNFITN